jgi:hypothetical protein
MNNMIEAKEYESLEIWADCEYGHNRLTDMEFVSVSDYMQVFSAAKEARKVAEEMRDRLSEMLNDHYQLPWENL